MATSVAVIIVTWNASKLIGGVLDALEAQTLRPGKIMVVDNGSADAESTELIIQGRPGVQLIRLADNHGFAAANNLAMAECTGLEYVALLNPDAFPRPDWLANLVDAARRYPTFGSFACRLLDYHDATLIDGAGDYVAPWGKPGRRGHGAQAAKRFLRYEEVLAPCAAAALYKLAAIRECGGFDEDFFCYVEDVDLGFRMLLAGHRCLYVPDAVVGHIGSALTGKRSDFSTYYGQRNIIFNFVKNMPGGLFWALLPLHIIMNLIGILYLMHRGQFRVGLKAKRDALCAIKSCWKKRQAIQRSRVTPVLVVAQLLFQHAIPARMENES